VPTHAAFLRGMNVGGHRITNAELAAVFSAAGFAEVHVFRASGNVAFAASEPPQGDLARSIEEGLLAALGYAVPTFVRTAAEVRAIAATSPFQSGRAAGRGGRPQVALLSGTPGAGERREVLALAGAGEQLVFAGSELHWLPSAGVLDSELDLRALEAALGPLTLRTKGTVDLLAAKHFAG